MPAPDTRPSVVRTVAAVAVHPGLWRTALAESWLLARPGWWRRWPPLPRPDPAYLRFRRQTAYGDAGQVMTPEEVVDYLRWCRRMRQMAR